MNNKKEITAYIRRLFEQNGMEVEPRQNRLFEAFAEAPGQQQAYHEIYNIQKRMKKDWIELSAIEDIRNKSLQLPNGKAGKPYSFTFDLPALGFENIAHFELQDWEDTGLSFDPATGTLSGTPAAAGEYKLRFCFRLDISDPEKPLAEKQLALIINADPKSLWRNLDSDKADEYWKEDEAILAMPFGEKQLIAASKRGRSHAHEGKFRDDDFAAVFNEATGWGIIAVSDGAGSARYSRRGAKIACETVKDFFQAQTTDDQYTQLETAIAAGSTSEATEETKKALSSMVIDLLQRAAYGAHKAIAEAAAAKSTAAKDFAATLLFALVKKTAVGWFIASFTVGDGGIGLYRKDQDVMLLGTPDGGEYAGQTRFITMQDIFTAEGFYQRFSVKIVPDFTALVLMTDGVTDPKFGTDAALMKKEKWDALWEDLNGKNEDGVGVDFAQAAAGSEADLLRWLDFWSPGNHDDRTIAILY